MNREYEVAEILDHRDSVHGREYLIRWKDYAQCEWEKESGMTGCRDLVKEYLRRKGIVDIKKVADNGCFKNAEIGVECVRQDKERGLIFALYFPHGKQYWCDLETMKKSYPKLLIDFFEKHLTFK